MRVIISNGNEVKINFKREQTFKNITLTGPYGILYDIQDAFNGVETTCYGKVGETVLFEATTRHHEEDLFTKAEGRRRSLSKALDRGNVSKEDRDLIWNAYFNSHRDLVDLVRK